MINFSAFQGKKAVFHTLGCKLNFSETSTFGATLKELGVVTVDENEPADLCIINTCSVTEMAEHKCRQIIRRMIRNNPNAFVVVTGCYAQLGGQEISKIDGVDLILGSNEKANLIQYLSEAWSEDRATKNNETQFYSVKLKDIKTFASSCSKGNRTRYFLKVQDGCDYFCTYCTIPFARGLSRNASISQLINQVKRAGDDGGKEIVLTGVNIGDFGKTTNEKFIDLIKELDKIETIERYRISSIEPDLLDNDIIEFCASSRAFMPHFHIPLQSGSNHVLELMKRRYNKELFADKVNKIKTLMPDAFIGVDIMTGCRGEEPKHFEDAFHFIESLDVTQLHVFPYSERPGTAALKIPNIVEEQEKRRRTKLLIELSDRKTQEFYSKYIGKTAKVLFEKSLQGRAMHGFTDNYIRVELPAKYSKDEFDNKVIDVKLGDFNHNKSALRVTII